MIMNKKLLLTSFFLRANACACCFDRLFRRGDFAPMVLEQCQNDW